MDFDTFIATNMNSPYEEIKFIIFNSSNMLIYYTYYNDKIYYNHRYNKINEHEINVFSSTPYGIFLNYEIILYSSHIDAPIPNNCLHIHNYVNENLHLFNIDEYVLK